MKPQDPTCVAVIGLGYVGLPLAAAFGRTMPTLGFDIAGDRVAELRAGVDRNGDVPSEDLRPSHITYTSSPADLADADAFIVAVPTPVDRAKRPDLRYLESASRIVGSVLSARRERTTAPAIVIYESTVYPGCTEEVCVPIVSQTSGLQPGRDFFYGYSPERINPGDHEHTLERVVKVASGQDAATLDVVARLYEKIVKAGVHRAASVQTAEAAKVIENTQRDVNIALMNELSVLFHRLGLDTSDVLAAARTKWNFLPFAPGLVGGHCIPEDPYYLTYRAQSVGHHPEVILAGRRINDSMGEFIAREAIRELLKARIDVPKARALMLGATFKEDVKDTRNTRVVDICRELAECGVRVQVHDPVAGSDAVAKLGLEPVAEPWQEPPFDLLIVAVAHEEFRAAGSAKLASLVRPHQGVVVDVKGIVDASVVRSQGLRYWRL